MLGGGVVLLACRSGCSDLPNRPGWPVPGLGGFKKNTEIRSGL